MRIISIIKRLIFLQLILIAFFCIVLHSKKNNALASRVSISPIDKNNVQQIQTEKLKYFYDLKPNLVVSSPAVSFIKKPIFYKYNNDGLNDSQNYPVNKEPGTYRIIALGDSFTYGLFVKTKNNWTEILERKLNENRLCKNINKFEVINLGVFGYDPEYEVERYRLKGQKYNPDLIIWTLVEAERLNELKSPSVYKCYSEHPDQWIPCWENGTKEVIQKYGMDYIINLQKQNIKKIANFYEKHIFFIDYYGFHSKIVDDIGNSTVLNNILSQNYLLKNHTSKEVQFPDTHPNELGHQIIANVIFDQLFKTNQIPCELFQ